MKMFASFSPFFRKKMKPHFSKEKRIKKRSDFQKLPGLPAYYIFQPGDITDENISIKYRYLPNYRHHKSFKLTDIAVVNTKKPRKIKKKGKLKIGKRNL